MKTTLKGCVILIHCLLHILQGIPGPRGQKGERGSSGPQVCFNMAAESFDFKRCFLVAPLLRAYLSSEYLITCIVDNKRVWMGVVESQLSMKFTAISKISVQFLAHLSAIT